eukprot:TRINITY_DN40352_c0_g1_i1.p1 TRINITY_DN40352_c0_g1~~TRINITY_DN40352_c0_g1_i1.p1  ORF type:complete len:820 (+),score=214.49 TRINITY_DN40352_c0_g1_i1:105-2564(+)
MAYPATGTGMGGMGGESDQAKLLDEASAVVKEQAHYMKKAVDADNVRDALKHASNMICELRTSLLTPKNYDRLFQLVFQEMQYISDFFGDKPRHGRKMIDLYESVQHAGNILPRLYLLATVAASYIKSMEAPAKEILKDVNELCKGVQHPIRGLFLRNYLSKMLKDKMPDAGTPYEGEGGDINDAFDFIFTNFQESNRLWVRIANQGPAREKERREKERYDLRQLVGENLWRLSNLDGITQEFYSSIALPKILEHIVSVKDSMSQQYLLECVIQVFPDDFHIRCLDQMLSAYAKAMPTVDMKPIMVTLMGRLSNFLSQDEADVGNVGDIFSLFRTHLQPILERALQPGQTSAPDMSGPLEVQAAFMNFTVSLYPDQVHYVDIILGSTAELLMKFKDSLGGDKRLPQNAAEQVVDLLSGPLKNLGLRVLEMENYAALVGFLNYETRKQVGLQMVAAIVEGNKPISSVEAVNTLFAFIGPLLKDEEDTPDDEGSSKASFREEQAQVCKLVHQVRNQDTDVEFAILSAMRGFFGQGGPQRLAFTLQPVFFAAVGLTNKIQAREKRRAEEGDEAVPPPQISLKKVFQFLHKTNTALSKHAPEISLHLWLVAAGVADQVERATGAQGAFEPICEEFLKQALIVYEEEFNDSNKQFKAIHSIVGTLYKIQNLDPENFDSISQTITKHSAKLLKKPMQCRAVAACSQLFFCPARKEPQRVRECLEKCLKTCESVVQSDVGNVGLWIELLDHCVFYFEAGCSEVNGTFVQTLINICNEQVTHAEGSSDSAAEGKKARQHFQASMKYLKNMKQSSDADIAARFAELSL